MTHQTIYRLHLGVRPTHVAGETAQSKPHVGQKAGRVVFGLIIL